MISASEPLPNLTLELERRFPIGQSTGDELAVTGQPYVELMAEAKSREEAMSAARKLFDEYVTRRYGTLYWRERPVMERARNGRKHVYRVRMAVLISENPVVQRLSAEAARLEMRKKAS